MNHHYYQHSDHEAWFLLTSQTGQDPVELAKAQGAKNLTILALNKATNDGGESEIPYNRDKISYRGPLYFDINCKDDLGQAIRSAQDLANKLIRMGMPKNLLQLYLSGSTGVHVLVSQTLLTGGDCRYTLRLPEIYKGMARNLFVIGLDFSVYNGGQGHSFHIANLQQHDGNYRVPVTVDELNALTVETYREWVKEPREVEVDDPHGLVVHELKALFEDCKKSINAKPKPVIIASSSDMEKIRETVPACIQQLCDSDGLKSDVSYNQAATQLATYIVRAGVSQSVAENLAARLASSAKSSKYATPKARRDHIEAQIRYVEHTPTFSFGCNAIRALLSKRPCEGCAIEGGIRDDRLDLSISAGASPDSYCLGINPVKMSSPNQFLSNQARSYFDDTTMCENGDQEVDQALFRYLKINQKHEIGRMVGWCISVHFKPHFMHRYSQFPILCLWGSTGSGKSQTAGLITCINGTDDMSQAAGVSAPLTSPTAMREYLSSTMTIPRIIEEFNPSKMTCKSYKDVGEQIKQVWSGEPTLKSRRGRSGLGLDNAKVIAIPMSAPVIVISEQEIEMPEIRERSIQVHLTTPKRAGNGDHFRIASKNRHQLRRFGKVVMTDALNTLPKEIEALMEKANNLLPVTMDDRPRFSLQVVLVGLWKLQEICNQLQLFLALSALDPIIKTLIERCGSDGESYSQSETDQVLQEMAVSIAILRSAEEASTGVVHLRAGLQYAVTPEYLILDPVLSHASYTRYCREDKRSAPVIGSAALFLKLIHKEPYFVKYEAYAGMAGGRPMLYLDLKIMESKGIDISLLSWGGKP